MLHKDNTYNLFSITESREGQYIWQYKRVLGGLQSCLSFTNKGNKVVLESRFFAKFEQYESEVRRWHKGVNLLPSFTSKLTMED